VKKLDGCQAILDDVLHSKDANISEQKSLQTPMEIESANLDGGYTPPDGKGVELEVCQAKLNDRLHSDGGQLNERPGLQVNEADQMHPETAQQTELDELDQIYPLYSPMNRMMAATFWALWTTASRCHSAQDIELVFLNRLYSKTAMMLPSSFTNFRCPNSYLRSSKFFFVES
jgi:hypothetical protein